MNFALSEYSLKGAFNNYVDKMSVFVHAQGIKTVHAGGGAKFSPLKIPDREEGQK